MNTLYKCLFIGIPASCAVVSVAIRKCCRWAIKNIYKLKRRSARDNIMKCSSLLRSAKKLTRKECKEKPKKATEKEEKQISRSVKKRSQILDKLLEAFKTELSKVDKFQKALEKREYRDEELLLIAKIRKTTEYQADYKAIVNGEDPIEGIQAFLRIMETFKAHIDF